MKCSSCGASLTEGARFCAQCAAPAPVEAPEHDPTREALAKALGTHYRVLRLLGRGGMGAVYLAHEDGLERDVAIKVLPPERASSPDTRERFRREARTAARLTHPNVVPLHTFGEVEGMMYYVMGYVRGESLAARLAREGRLPEPETRRLLAEIARRWTTRTSRGSYTATSSPTTSCSRKAAGARCSPTSASRRRSLAARA